MGTLKLFEVIKTFIFGKANLNNSTNSDNENAKPKSIVLLVDDQAMVAEGIRRMLAGENDIQLHYCPDARQAVKKANEVKPTIIFQELNLSNIDGFLLIKAFRENAATSLTPVVIISSNTDPKVKSDSFEMGARDYIVKLPDRIELIARIRAYTKAYLLQMKQDREYLELKKQLEQLRR